MEQSSELLSSGHTGLPVATLFTSVSTGLVQTPSSKLEAAKSASYIFSLSYCLGKAEDCKHLETSVCSQAFNITLPKIIPSALDQRQSPSPRFNFVILQVKPVLQFRFPSHSP